MSINVGDKVRLVKYKQIRSLDGVKIGDVGIVTNIDSFFNVNFGSHRTYLFIRDEIEPVNEDSGFLVRTTEGNYYFNLENDAINFVKGPTESGITKIYKVVPYKTLKRKEVVTYDVEEI